MMQYKNSNIICSKCLKPEIAKLLLEVFEKSKLFSTIHIIESYNLRIGYNLFTLHVLLALNNKKRPDQLIFLLI